MQLKIALFLSVIITLASAGVAQAMSIEGFNKLVRDAKTTTKQLVDAYDALVYPTHKPLADNSLLRLRNTTIAKLRDELKRAQRKDNGRKDNDIELEEEAEEEIDWGF